MTDREITPEIQAKMLEKVGKLIAMSEDDTLTPEARATYAEKAQKLMEEYRLQEEEIITSGSAAVTPESFEITLVEGLGRYFASEFQDAYLRIWREVAKHAGLKSHAEYRYDEDENARKVVAVGYGFQIDIRLAQFLWTSAHLTFATRIDTKVNPALSDQENCYYMRASGMERIEIAAKLWGEETRKSGAAHGKVHKLYLAECAARGEEPTVGGKGFQAKRYRESYANGFVDQFGWRLRDARSAVDAESGGLVLHGRIERVEEAYYAAYPDRAPISDEERAAREAKTAEYWAERERQERECLAKGNCASAMKRAEKMAAERGWGLSQSEADRARCKKHRPYEATASERARWDRERSAPERTAGRRAGTAAASAVSFSRTAGERTQKAPAAPERRALS